METTRLAHQGRAWWRDEVGAVYVGEVDAVLDLAEVRVGVRVRVRVRVGLGLGLGLGLG